ncbi:MAG: sulfatase-like hydrolase/transferase, partial [Verrucomicrobiota bacterium]
SAVGQLLAQLEEDGLAENTIVFFYSDHGSGMPRHKRLLHDSGMQVPLIIRFPEKFQHLAPAAAGETVDDLVTFVDFPPSLLALAGLEAPEHFQGQTFLGAEPAEPREFVYGFRDRIDEVFDLSRSVRTQRYLYIRNYHPHLSWMQPSVFSDLGEIRQDLARELATKGTELTAAQLGFMGPTRTIEEFYDLAADPHNVSNLLAGEMSPQETEALEELRKVFQAERLRIGDTGVLPESYVIDQIQEEEAVLLDIIDGKTNHRPDLELVWEAADRVGTATDADFLIEELIYGDVPIRYWTVVALRNGFFDDAEVHDKVVDYLEDIAPSVRIEVASWLAAASDSHRATALSVLQTDIMNPQWHTALRACRAIELLGETASSTIPAMGALYNRTRFGQGDGDLFIAFSAGAFLEAMGMPTEPWDFAP